MAEVRLTEMELDAHGTGFDIYLWIDRLHQRLGVDWTLWVRRGGFSVLLDDATVVSG